MAAEDAIRKVIHRDLSYIERIEKTYGVNGFLDRKIMEIDGDISYLGDVRKALEDVYRALEELEYGALAHKDTQESVDTSFEESDDFQDLKRHAGL